MKILLNKINKTQMLYQKTKEINYLSKKIIYNNKKYNL